MYDIWDFQLAFPLKHVDLVTPIWRQFVVYGARREKRSLNSIDEQDNAILPILVTLCLIAVFLVCGLVAVVCGSRGMRRSFAAHSRKSKAAMASELEEAQEMPAHAVQGCTHGLACEPHLLRENAEWCLGSTEERTDQLEEGYSAACSGKSAAFVREEIVCRVITEPPLIREKTEWSLWEGRQNGEPDIADRFTQQEPREHSWSHRRDVCPVVGKNTLELPMDLDEVTLSGAMCCVCNPAQLVAKA